MWKGRLETMTTDIIKYPKINTLYKRDNKTFKIIQNEYSEDYYSIINEWHVDEKIDGTNIRFCFDDNSVTFRGRTDNAELPRPLKTFLEETFTSDKLKEAFPNSEPNSIVLFGEGYGEKIQSGGDYRLGQGFILFDVKIGSLWLQRHNVHDIAIKLNVPSVPSYGIMKTQDIIDLVRSRPQSKCSINPKISEGIIARTDFLDRRGNRVMFKLKVCDYDN
jgi:hypothetical protein